jgi:hypothetical protein
MSQPSPRSPAPGAYASVDDLWLQRGRELIAALLALIVVVGTALLIGNAFKFVSVDDTKDQSFQHAKDLLNIVLPLLGVVLGYYFNKVSTEKRAETAERSAQTATTSAQQANEARHQVETENRETKDTLKEVSNAAEKLLGPQESTLDVLSGTTSANSSPQLARAELRAALDRAKRYVQ